MTPSGAETAESAYLSPEQLYIGAFVMLELAWFKHSFTLNHFKVCSQDQLNALLALELPLYKYDPLRSDPAPCSIAASSAQAATALTPIAQRDPALLLQRRVRQRRDSVERVQRAFSKATAVIKNMNKNLLSRPKETLQELGLLVDEMVLVFLSSPDATLHVMGEKTGSDDVYTHCLNVAILSMMMAKDMGIGPQDARELCLGALLHDIGLNDIPYHIVKRPPAEASQAELNFRATHVERGLAIGKKVGLSAQALAILAQHHEFADGSGYPKGIQREAMTPGALVVSLVNYYDELCNPTDASKSLTPHEALSYMFAHCRPKFELRALQLLIRCLGVHPPGSIVQLSNASVAVVTSVNPQKPLRPWVLVYDASVPKDEALMLNLETEPDLQILKSIRPVLLSPKVAAYLDPRKRVTYFFDGGNTASNGATA